MDDEAGKVIKRAHEWLSTAAEYIESGGKSRPEPPEELAERIRTAAADLQRLTRE